jgi:SAM-dependent methyltransferase
MSDYITTLQLNTIQYLFVQWRAEVLGISEQESIDRFIGSWNAAPHDSVAFRKFILQAHELMRPFYDDSPGEIFKAHRMHQYLHMLRWMSYAPDPLPLDLAGDKKQVTLLDYGCGMALRSIETAMAWLKCGIEVRLVLADIETEITPFLKYACKKLDIPVDVRSMTFIPVCDVAIVTEVWEHLYDPIPALKMLDLALKPGGYLMTDFSDRQVEMFHVSPDLSALRKQFAQMDYEQVGDYVWRKNASPGN